MKHSKLLFISFLFSICFACTIFTACSMNPSPQDSAPSKSGYQVKSESMDKALSGLYCFTGDFDGGTNSMLEINAEEGILTYFSYGYYHVYPDKKKHRILAMNEYPDTAPVTYIMKKSKNEAWEAFDYEEENNDIGDNAVFKLKYRNGQDGIANLTSSKMPARTFSGSYFCNGTYNTVIRFYENGTSETTYSLAFTMDGEQIIFDKVNMSYSYDRDTNVLAMHLTHEGENVDITYTKVAETYPADQTGKNGFPYYKLTDGRYWKDGVVYNSASSLKKAIASS